MKHLSTTPDFKSLFWRLTFWDEETKVLLSCVFFLQQTAPHAHNLLWSDLWSGWEKHSFLKGKNYLFFTIRYACSMETSGPVREYRREVWTDQRAELFKDVVDSDRWLLIIFAWRRTVEEEKIVPLRWSDERPIRPPHTPGTDRKDSIVMFHPHLQVTSIKVAEASYCWTSFTVLIQNQKIL